MPETITLPNVEIDVDGFPIIGADNVVTPPQAAIFKRDGDVLDILNPRKEVTVTPTPSESPETKSTADQQKDLLTEIVNQDNGTPKVDDDRPTTTGKAKTDKSALVDYLKTKIEAKEFVTFDDYDEKVPVDDYLANLTNKDLNALVDENIKLKETKFQEEIPKQFYETLPEDFKTVYDYIASGGRDLKGIYKALGEVREIKELDPNKEDHQEEIVFQYLENANPDWTEEEIKEQVQEWKDLGTIEKKASQLKPKLDKIKEQFVQDQLREQQEFARQRQEAANKYVENVYNALKPGEIGGIKIDNKRQVAIYNGLVNAQYKSISGGQTNLLGHLLEKYQYQEPNYGKISKVLWLLEDEEGFEAAISQKAVNKNTEEVVRKLKTEQGNRSSSVSIEDEGNARRTSNRISRGANPFQR